MRLSEAIQLGSMLGPQAFGDFNKTRRKYLFGLVGPKVTSYCALGAALTAVGWDAAVTYKWTVLSRIGTCPVCSRHSLFERLIPHLNDQHRWTRERIANFVEAKEDEIAAERRELTCSVTYHGESLDTTVTD